MGRACFAGSRKICERRRSRVSHNKKVRLHQVPFIRLFKKSRPIEVEKSCRLSYHYHLASMNFEKHFNEKAWLISVVEMQNCDKIKGLGMDEG